MLVFGNISKGRNWLKFEDSNVGYQLIPVPSGYSLFTPTFKDVAQTSIDLTTIVLCDADGQELDNYNEVGIQKMDDTGAYLDTYSYATGFGWNVDYESIAAGDVVFSLGEAVCVNNDSGDTVYLRVAGEVDMVNQNAIGTGYVLWGNSTPVAIDMTAVGIVDENGDELDTYNEIGLQKMDDTGA